MNVVGVATIWKNVVAKAEHRSHGDGSAPIVKMTFALFASPVKSTPGLVPVPVQPVLAPVPVDQSQYQHQHRLLNPLHVLIAGV
jgi:hypothetical protein